MQKGDETREKIRETALNLFHSRGYKSTSINDIIQSTGVKKGNLYFHYSSKEELAIEVLNEALSIYEEYIASKVNGKTSVEKLISIIDAITGFHVNGDFASGCIFGNMALESGGNGSEISEFVRGVFEAWESNFVRLLDRGVKDGELKLKERPEVFARMVIASIEGGIMLSKIYGKSDPLVSCAGFIRDSLLERSTAAGSDYTKREGI